MPDQTTPTDPRMPSEYYTKGKENEVVWMGGEGLQTPTKTITLTNNSQQTVYPFLIAQNNAEACSTYDSNAKQYACSNYDPNDPTKNPGSIYDPEDPYDQGYRGYIGYTGQDGINYLGLPAGQTVIITVPLVFWDSSRIYVANTSEYLTNDATEGQGGLINPFQYYRYNRDNTETLRLYQSFGHLTPSGLNAVVMWYHAVVPHILPDDAPAQIVEFTIRDPWQQQKLNTYLDINSLGPLINYDVSYVDNIYFPVAMEATDALVPVPNSTMTAPFGWIGTSQTEEQFQNALKTFTLSGSDNGLGTYFGTDTNGTRGFTQFNIPNSVSVKLPSGATAMADSPFKDTRSSYDPDNNVYMLSSGGTAGIEASINASPDPNGSKSLPITFNSGPSGYAQKETLKQATPGTMDVTCTDANHQQLIPAETKLLSYTIDKSEATGTAILSNATTPVQPDTSCTVNFKRPVTDYVTTAIVSLWYSWAEYYLKATKQVQSQTYQGSITAPSPDPYQLSRLLTFDTPIRISGTQLPLVPGMLVTGPGIPTSPDGTFCTIADVIQSKDEPVILAVKLSQFVPGDSASNYPSGTYNFAPPQPIKGYQDSILQTVSLAFDTDSERAMSFSQTVYQAMSAISTIPPISNYNYVSIWVIYNIIGCNTGQVPNIGNDKKAPDIAAEITVNIKSALRGVPDFRDTINWPESKWYPEPSTPTGGCTFNAYNVDPYVWFVHKQLGLSAYGFSVDDDTSDVGAYAATNLQISIGGLDGLKTLGQWSNGTPFGPVSGSGQLTIETDQHGNPVYKIANLPHTSDNPVYWMIMNPDTSAGQQGALVNGKSIQPGTWVQATDNSDYSVILQSASPDTPPFPDNANGSTSTYAFFGSVVGVGQTQSPNTITGLDAAVFDQLNTIVTQTGNPVKVAGPGIPLGTMVQSVDPTNSSVTLIFPQGGQLQPSSGVYTFG